MNFFKNIKFLSQLTYNNVRQYFKVQLSSLQEPLYKNSIHWYGHATTLINIDNKIILTDPVIGNMLGYFRRISKESINIRDYKIDYILLSHGHMDHLNFSTLRKLNKDAIIIVPKGYKKIIELLGFKNVVQLRLNEVYEDDNIKITSYAANHDGRRFYIGIDDESHSYLIERNNKSIFFAGDTAYTENFNGISCDVALMPVGCYKPERFSYMHCNPKESYKMFTMMNAKCMIPIHYKTFKIALDTFTETEDILYSLNDSRIKILNIGQTYRFNTKD